MYYRLDGLELVMQQDDKISTQLEEVDNRIEDMLQYKQTIFSESAYLSESYEDIDYNILSLLEESDSLDIVDQSIDDIIDSNELDDSFGSIIDLVAGL